MSTEISTQNTCVNDLYFNDDNTADFSLALWFDVDDRFNVNTSEDDSAWLNAYAVYDFDSHSVSLLVYYESDSKCYVIPCCLTERESEAIRILISDYFRKEYKSELCNWDTSFEY